MNMESNKCNETCKSCPGDSEKFCDVIGKLQKSVEEMQVVLEGTIQALALLAQRRDPYTAGHERRVAVLSKAIAEELGFEQDDVQGIYLSATIHDIGKIAVPAEILAKPGGLSAIEFDLIKTHPEVGYEILKHVQFPWPVPSVVLQHHERLDGSGYPRGLKKADIHIAARIVAVADVVEGMSNHRPYRPALGIDDAMAHIKRGRGVLYDQDAVDACVLICRNHKGQDLFSEICYNA